MKLHPPSAPVVKRTTFGQLSTTHRAGLLSRRGLGIGAWLGGWCFNSQMAWAQGVQVVSGGAGNVNMVDAIIVVVLIGLAVFSVCYSSRRY